MLLLISKRLVVLQILFVLYLKSSVTRNVCLSLFDTQLKPNRFKQFVDTKFLVAPSIPIPSISTSMLFILILNVPVSTSTSLSPSITFKQISSLPVFVNLWSLLSKMLCVVKESRYIRLHSQSNCHSLSSDDSKFIFGSSMFLISVL